VVGERSNGVIDQIKKSYQLQKRKEEAKQIFREEAKDALQAWKEQTARLLVVSWKIIEYTAEEEVSEAVIGAWMAHELKRVLNACLNDCAMCYDIIDLAMQQLRRERDEKEHKTGRFN